MEIKRIKSYDDNRFSQTVLHQHGCFLADGKPYEVEIISDYEAVISGENQTGYSKIIEEFRFYTPHITRFYSREGQIVKEYPRAQLLTLCLDQIQPSQFFVDADKISSDRVDAIAFCVNAGIINGYEDKTVKPAGTATRAEVSAMIYRFANLEK